MTDAYLFALAISYHEYLTRLNSANPAHPFYAIMIVKHVWFDDHETCEDMTQVYRVARWFRRYLKRG